MDTQNEQQVSYEAPVVLDYGSIADNTFRKLDRPQAPGFSTF